jgi:2-oxoglutarate dehydrogenase E2 component (dihydrolipoamide succinyltransferase)
MGESLAEGTLTKWFKKVGDAVKRDETIFEISTDKVDSEVQAVSAGVLAEILVKEGETVPVNASSLPKPTRALPRCTSLRQKLPAACRRR